MTGRHVTGLVGLGASGVALLRELVVGGGEHDVIAFNPAGSLARGAPYADCATEGLLLNRPVATMDLATSPTGAFAAWIDEHDAADLAGTPPEVLFLQRKVFGRFLLDELADILAQADDTNVRITIITDRVVDVRREAGGARYIVQTAASGDYWVDHLVLATGHSPPRDLYGLAGHPRYVSTTQQLDQVTAMIPSGANVLILGTRLSAIETALELLRHGHRGRIELASRGGRLPSVRGRNAPWQPLFFTESGVAAKAGSGGGTLHLADARELLCDELEAGGVTLAEIGLTAWACPVEQLRDDAQAANSPIAWQSVLAASNRAVTAVWRFLDPAQRRSFVRRHHSDWMSRRVPMPREVSHELLAAIDDGALAVVNGVTRVRVDGAGVVVRSNAPDWPADWVVNATGGDSTVCLHEGSPAASLLRKGMATANPLGGLYVDFDTCRLLDRQKRPTERIYALGTLTAGDYYMTSAVDVIALQAGRVARSLGSTAPSAAETDR